MSNMKNKLFLLLLLFSVVIYGTDALKPSGESVKLDSIQKYVILLPENPTEQDVFAAELFVKYLKEITGISLTVKKEPFSKKGPVISIGETDLAKKNDVPVCVGQSYRLTFRDRDFFIKGSVYGVIAILE